MSERKYMVLTVVGPDRPGLVQEVSSAIHEAGANLEDSRAAILGGEFALILLFSGSSGQVNQVKSRASSFESKLGLRTLLHETSRADAPRSYLPYRLRVNGVDRPGIVASVSKVLAGLGVNVASLESRVQYAPESGTPMFVLSAEVQVPSEAVLPSLRKNLATLCEEENLDSSLETS